MPVANRHVARRPQLERRTPLVALAAARGVLEEAGQYLGTPLPGRYAGLAHRARRIYAHSPHFRRLMHQPADVGRDELWGFLRHWLAARLQAERPDLFARLPSAYATGAELPDTPPPAADPWLSPAARLLA